MADSDKPRYSPSLMRMWRVYRTAKEMCMDRGYNILEEDTTITLEEFAGKFAREDGEPDRQRMPFSCEPSDEMLRKYSAPPTAKDPNPQPQIGQLWVEFNADENVGLKQLRDYMQHLSNHNFYSGIMVCIKPMTGMALRLLRGASGLDEGPKGGVEVFVEQDLLVNITKHELVPKHVLLSREEKAQLLERYRLKETQLPRIQVTDPVAKYLGLRRGQVVKIIRKSETAGRYASYRWAI
ncbi:DNA-directed RNA polymerases I [Lophiotrema nucula]|uniref:DNA-directed RNA polymerases I, II, and III subunit RPABC1 n=1 Tax=Lophiotrema nucula TaxID=690887 RepID=A0A6A5Z7Q1_9PLEO|nr:DNA-directed RNA polymerases I [Lophiotrema nucula]